MKKSERTEKINVRIIKKPSKKRTEFQKIEPKKENKKNHYSKEAKKNKTKITLIILYPWIKKRIRQIGH